MSRAKVGVPRIEMEIEKNREESNWLKVIELAKQLKERNSDSVCLADFLIGEGLLENYLEEYPAVDGNVNKAKLELIEAKRHLNSVITEAGIKANVAMDGHLLLGKLAYSCGFYSEGLQHFKKADLQNLSEMKLPFCLREQPWLTNRFCRRSLRVVAESYAIKGLCLQKDNTASSKFKKQERDEELTKCLDLASDLTLLYMQKSEKEIPSGAGTHSPQPSSLSKSLGVVLEYALQEAPIVMHQQNKLADCLERFRRTLQAVEVPWVNTMRLKIMCQMVEVLLQGQIGQKYSSPAMAKEKNSLWKPQNYSAINQFVPANEFEETILVLLVAESIAVRNAVLSQSPEFKEDRLSAYQDAATVYDLLTVATVRWGQVKLLQESLEHAMKFSFGELHLWKQHALSLVSIGNYKHALAVFKEVIRLEPNNSSNFLLAAKVCFEHLNLPVEGTSYALQAKLIEVNQPTGLLARCHLLVGLGYYLQAENTLLKKEKNSLRNLSLDNFQSAVELDQFDHLARYYLGLLLATNGRIDEAHQHVHLGLNLQPEHSSMLHLYVLLLTAKQNYKIALLFVEEALQEYPDSLNLMYVKAQLELHEFGGEKALITSKKMLEMWKNLYENQTSSDVPECDRKSDTRSVFQLYPSEMSDKDSSSLQLHNTAASRVEQALSEVASSLSSFNPRPGPQRAWMLQLEVWLLLAELYLTLDQAEDVQQCIQEASNIYPLSHHIIHMKGLLHVHRQQWPEAKLCFQNAIAINPQHVKSLQQLGLVYHYMGLQGLAENTLREAIRVEPKNHISWYNLGIVLEALGEYEKASSAMSTALAMEINNPILPLNSVPLAFD